MVIFLCAIFFGYYILMGILGVGVAAMFEPRILVIPAIIFIFGFLRARADHLGTFD